MCTNMIFLGFVSILFLVKKHYLNTLVSINLNFLKIYLYFLFICIFWYFVVSYFIHYTILLKFCMIHLSYILPSFAVGFVEYFPHSWTQTQTRLHVSQMASWPNMLFTHATSSPWLFCHMFGYENSVNIWSNQFEMLLQMRLWWWCVWPALGHLDVCNSACDAGLLITFADRSPGHNANSWITDNTCFP